MPYRCLTDFLEELNQSGALTRVEDGVAPALDVAEIVAKATVSGGPALLFVGVKGHDLPVLANLLATEGRICRALGVETLDEPANRLARLLDNSTPEGWFERLRGGSQPAAIGGVVPREVKSAPCQQIVRLGSDIDLAELPLLSCGAPASCNATAAFSRAIHSAAVLSAEPDSRRPVCSRFDLQRIDATRLAVSWASHDEHSRLLGEYRARNQRMPLAVVIGGDPAFMLAASAPLPPGDVCALTGLLRQKPIDVVACRGVDLLVPAEAEIVLEGFVDPAESPVEVGPLCGPTGHATLPTVAPVMHVTAMTQRANPIYAAMVPGRPPHEAVVVTRAMQRVFLPLTRAAMPDLVDYDMPEFAAARHWAAVSIRKTYAGQGRRAAHAAWGLPPMRFAKMLIVVDSDVDVRNHDAVLAAVTANANPTKDVLHDQGPADPFDPAATRGELGQRMAIDATRKLAGE
jgi:4-hydroxy-3-polyprenylbenzoate decarboxylase